MLARTDGVVTVAASGIAIGLVAAVALSPVIEALLFGVTARDPVTYVVVGATLATVALLACYVPAVRATKSSRSSRCVATERAAPPGGAAACGRSAVG